MIVPALREFLIGLGRFLAAAAAGSPGRSAAAGLKLLSWFSRSIEDGLASAPHPFSPAWQRRVHILLVTMIAPAVSLELLSIFSVLAGQS